MLRLTGSNTFKRIALLLCITLMMGLTLSMIGCMGGDGAEETPAPTGTNDTGDTAGDTSETPEETTPADTSEETAPAESGEAIVPDDNMPKWDLAALMAVAEEQGTTDEEKYGNQIVITSAITGLILLDYTTVFHNSPSSRIFYGYD